MKFKDILPNSIYRVNGTEATDGFYFRTGDTPTAVPGPRAAYNSKRNTHLLLTIDRGYRWSEDNPELDRYVDQVEVLRWVDHASGSHGVVHGDETFDLTFQPVPFVTSIGNLDRSYGWDIEHLPVDSVPADFAQQVADWDAAYDVYSNAYDEEEARVSNDDTVDSNYPSDEWHEANPEPEDNPEDQLAKALIAEWGTQYFHFVGDRAWRSETRSRRSTVHHGGSVPLGRIIGPYTEAERANTILTERAEKAEAEARYKVESKVRRAAETEAKAFLVTTLANVPDALLEQASNGLDRAVEQARRNGISDWSLDGGWRDDPDTETPDGGSLVGLKASTLSAITYAWKATFGDASWEDIAAGVYVRYHESDEVKHIGVKVPKTEDVEDTAKRVAAYLPSNYEVVSTETYRNGSQVLVKGIDVAGWTADGYVIPRLATGLLVAEVYSLSRQAVTA